MAVTFPNRRDGPPEREESVSRGLVAWGDSTQDNCHPLKVAHSHCIAWAKRYGATFALEKYQLIHFTKQRHDPTSDLVSHV